MFGPQVQQAQAQDFDPLVPVAEGLKWPGVTGLIGYGGRLWFVNSVKFRNHNSADIYSFGPGTGDTRYERHLMSQDAGDPVIANGLLYWPFEDSRFSPGIGEFSVTNGKTWRWGMVADGRAFHLHAMGRHEGVLYGAVSAWRALLQRSFDRGTTWKQIHAFPSPDGRVSRIVSLKSFKGALWAGVTAWYDETSPKLFRWTGDRLDPAPGWPDSGSVPYAVRFGDWLYGEVVASAGNAVWRTDGKTSERIAALNEMNVMKLAAGKEAIWAVTSWRGGGALHRSTDGVSWEEMQRFSGFQPLDMTVYGGRIYVGGRRAGTGVLMGPTVQKAVSPGLVSDDLPRARELPKTDADTAFGTFEEILKDPRRYAELRQALRPLARSADPAVGRRLATLLENTFPAGGSPMFGGALTVPSDKMARWYLLWAMAHNGEGRVPISLINEPWSQRPNRAEKYLDAPPAAAWAAAELGQMDRATLKALIDRLDRTGDPDWLAGDMIGALTVLTGERFGWDIPAWKRWWAAQPE